MNMVFIKKHYKDLTFALFTIILYFFTRLYRISSLPIFTDEAIYTRWSQIAKQDASWRFISLTDGKQPLFVWLDMIVMRFIHDPLLAGRLVSVGAGFFTVLGLFFLGNEIFKNKKIGFLAAFTYVIFPFALVYDKMALYDSLVATITVWALYFEVLLIRRIKFEIAFMLALVIGAGLLTKSSGSFSIYLLPFSLLLFDFKQKNKRQKLFRWLGFVLVAVLLSLLYESVLRLSPFFHVISEKNSLFVYPFNEWIHHPFNYLEGNLRGLLDWLITYSTIPIIILVLASFILDKKKFLGEKLFLFLWFLAPFSALALFGRTLYPRFILFMTMPLLVLVAYSIYYILGITKNNVFKLLFIFISVILMIRTDYYILTNFAIAPIPYADLQQYINDWPAGGGIKEMVEFFRFQSSTKKIYVASQGTFGSLPTYAVEIYLGEDKNVEKRGIWPIPDKIPSDLVEKAKHMSVYFVFNQTKTPPFGWPVRLIASYKKGVGDAELNIYQVVSK